MSGLSAALCQWSGARNPAGRIIGSPLGAGAHGIGGVVFQFQLVKRIDALPLTRDYMADAEQRLLQQDDAIDARPRLVGE